MDLAIDILSRFGIGGLFAYLFYLIMRELVKSKIEIFRREQEKDVAILRDKLQNMETSLSKHFSRHKDSEQSLCSKIDRLYDKFEKVHDRLNSQAEMLSQIKGYMRAHDDKGQ